MGKKALKLNIQHFSGDAEARLEEITTQKKELRSQVAGSNDLNQLQVINAQLDTLIGEEQELRDALAARKPEEIRQQPIGAAAIIGAYGVGTETEPNGEDKRAEELATAEKRGADLFERRSIMVSSDPLVTPTHDSANINEGFNQVSGLIDMVTITPLDGGESYDVPYEIKHGEGGYTREGENYHGVDHKFGYARIHKSKITAYNEVTEEVLKLPRAAYGDRVVQGVHKALRRKIAREILIGRGGNNDEFVGIFSPLATAIDPATDIEISEIDNTTLDTIIFSYGGEEDVEAPAVLILSKADLRKFAMVRDETGRKYYEIKTTGNTGTINGVQYVLNSGAGSLDRASEGDYLMAYGPLENYEMAVFSQTEVLRSDDYKFKQGIIAHRGSVFSGGNVVTHNGFVRVKKGGALEPETMSMKKTAKKS